jgi:hypothetical protein
VIYTAPVIHPVRAHRCPWQTSQCGMGSMPYRMCDICKKKLGVHSVLGARRQNLSRLRVEILDTRMYVPAVARSFQLPTMKFLRARPCLYHVGWSPRATDIPLCCSSWVGSTAAAVPRHCRQTGASSWAVSSLYLPKTALAALASACPFPVTASPSSPAYTYLKQQLQPVQIFNQKI